MKVAAIVAIIIAVLGIGFLFMMGRQGQQINIPSTNQPSPTVTAITPSDTQTSFCTPSQLQAAAQPDVAAGNVYVTLTIQNTSQTTCQIIGNNSLSVGYPNSVTNFQIAHMGQASTPVFTLQPNQTIYSLIHFPNGPQCSSEATGVDAMVSYDISQSDSVSFVPTSGPTISIPSCGNPSEITTIDLYPFSTSQVTPQ